MHKRPLSPHLQIYKWQWTMFYSILHRLSGVFLSVGVVFLCAWIYTIAWDIENFHHIQTFILSPIGRLILFAWTGSLFYHLFNGVRHLLWDCGLFLDLKKAEYSGHASLGLAVIFTVASWGCAYQIF